MKNVSRKRRLEIRINRKAAKRGLAALLAGCLLVGGLAACGDKEKDSSSSTGSGLASIPPVAATAAPTPAATAKAVKVTADVLNVRKSASTDSDILGMVEEDAKLALLSETAEDGWYQVQYEGGPAFVSAEFVQVVDITIEQYQQLMTAPTASPTATPEAGATNAPGGASPSPAATASPAPGSDEDGD